MEDFQYRILISMVSAATTLLGSVGIFVSMTVQRRVERLQAILEEFLDLSYHSDSNTTAKMFKMIEKYQMHYMFPDAPGKIILQYINFTIITVIISWLIILVREFNRSWSILGLTGFIPLLMGLGILIFYRHLLKNIIYPFGNNLMSPLIPPPIKLRSVSFLSRYVNISVKSLLRQARLRLLVKPLSDGQYKVILKEELSFDDYRYYLVLSAKKQPIFIAYGELKILFGNEKVTGKPIPVAKNINIPLGCISEEQLFETEYEARFLIFPRGEKHPLEYLFNLHKQGNLVVMAGEPEISINYMITYQISRGNFTLIEETAEIPFFRLLAGISVHKERLYWCPPFSPQQAEKCKQEIYID